MADNVPAHVQEAAEEWTELHRRYWSARSLLLDWVGDSGPIRLADNRLLGYQPAGNDWNDEAVAELFPALIKAAEVRFAGPLPQIERVMSLVLEEIPDVTWNVSRKVDGTAANALLRAGGTAAERLLPHRVQKSRLGVR